MQRPYHTLSLILFLFTLILPATAAQARPLSLPLFQSASSTPETFTSTPEPAIPSPADIINAVNNLRLANGLNVLSVHPVLMEVAAQQASALAASEGAVGHQRPCGMTLGQQLLSLGFPLWGDLSQDGYRSENWVMASTVEQVMAFWQSMKNTPTRWSLIFAVTSVRRSRSVTRSMWCWKPPCQLPHANIKIRLTIF